MIERHLDVTKHADWIVAMGPEGGSVGGNVVVSGSPEEVARHETSFTGRFLNPLWTRGRCESDWLRFLFAIQHRGRGFEKGLRSGSASNPSRIKHL